jgi:hypothetical protein
MLTFYSLFFQVRGTVRSVKDLVKVGALLSALGDGVELLEADLNDPKAFFSVFKGTFRTRVTEIKLPTFLIGFFSSILGCKWVIHTASPYTLNVKDAQKDLVVRDGRCDQNSAPYSTFLSSLLLHRILQSMELLP